MEESLATSLFLTLQATQTNTPVDREEGQRASAREWGEAGRIAVPYETKDLTQISAYVLVLPPCLTFVRIFIGHVLLDEQSCKGRQATTMFDYFKSTVSPHRRI